ncbi:MAG: tetratricopeptide repeat protein [Cyanothece sp. SIO2G6]|nr:tetratricopeptide repeat protein [Cyanothece sp. SIO2G6]
MSDDSQNSTSQPPLDNPKEMAETFYQAGKAAFESGQYRQAISMLEKAIALLPNTSILGGEAGIWLVMAQDAAGRYEDAIALCTKLAKHPHTETAQQGKRLLYILKAPKLKTNPEWNSKIPDLSQIGEGEGNAATLSSYPKPKARKRKPKEESEELEPIDWSQIDTQDNQFIAIALGVMSLLLLGWVWLS